MGQVGIGVRSGQITLGDFSNYFRTFLGGNKYSAGQYINGSEVRNFSSSGVTVSTLLNVLYASPMTIHRPTSFDRCGGRINSGGAGNAYIGIYSNDANNFPGTLLQSSGSMVLPASGYFSDPFSVTLSPGFYWSVILLSVTGISFFGRLDGSQHIPYNFVLPAGPWCNLINTYSFNPLPASYPTAGTTLGTGVSPNIYFRVV
jgi:hypothetical protein